LFYVFELIDRQKGEKTVILIALTLINSPESVASKSWMTEPSFPAEVANRKSSLGTLPPNLKWKTIFNFRKNLEIQKVFEEEVCRP
jgi:hypothetical protein